jgi:hypothetical protein
MPIMWTFRVRHFGSSSTCVSNDTLEDGLERPESIEEEEGEEERGECVYTLRRLKRR